MAKKELKSVLTLGAWLPSGAFKNLCALNKHTHTNNNPSRNKQKNYILPNPDIIGIIYCKLKIHITQFYSCSFSLLIAQDYRIILGQSSF